MPTDDKTPSRQPQIDAELEDIDRATSRISECIPRLEGALAKVMQPLCPPLTEEPQRVPLAGILHQIKCRLNTYASDLQAIINNLEISGS